MTRAQLRAAAHTILRAGLAAVEPGKLVRGHLRVQGRAIRAGGVTIKDPKRVFLVSVGKAAVSMAKAAQAILGDRMTEAILIAPWKAPRMKRTVGFVAGHPVPDHAGVRAAQRVIRLLKRAERGDLVLLLLSGGASALMPAPIAGVSLGDKQRLTRLLLRRGATIEEINSVRKRLSQLKGGGFARIAAPASVITLALSDVPGHDIRTIGSGPTIVDPRALSLARRTVSRFLRTREVSAGVRTALRKPQPMRTSSSVKSRAIVIGSGQTFARAAKEEARKQGFRARVLVDALKGQARICGPALVAKFEHLRGQRTLCLIATGETVVRVRGIGVGGRNQELALSAASALARLPRPTVLCALATDGRDGTASASGGLVDDRTEHRAAACGLSVQAALDGNNSTAALRRLGGLLRNGPTGTNVADVTLLLG